MHRERKKKTPKRAMSVVSERDLVKPANVAGVYGKRLVDPVLGSYFKLPKRNSHFPNVILDTSFPYVFITLILISDNIHVKSRFLIDSSLSAFNSSTYADI